MHEVFGEGGPQVGYYPWVRLLYTHVKYPAEKLVEARWFCKKIGYWPGVLNWILKTFGYYCIVYRI